MNVSFAGYLTVLGYYFYMSRTTSNQTADIETSLDLKHCFNDLRTVVERPFDSYNGLARTIRFE